MENPLAAGEPEHRVAIKRPEIIKFTTATPRRKPRPPVSAAERIAALMIVRHGANAAREATIRLNQMIDRGNLPARDLWACIVHIIHERRAC